MKFSESSRRSRISYERLKVTYFVYLHYITPRILRHSPLVTKHCSSSSFVQLKLTMATEIPRDKKLPSVFLGQSGMKVSNLCLGTMTFGESQMGRPGQSDEDLSHQIINRFVDWGGNFFDTANVYGRGVSESILGKWLER
ncbi:hypothetical protein Btru_074714 [Bulinus truncatus]|nr:hypothetical protein Btru_074714 [Bulinus truncatus]